MSISAKDVKALRDRTGAGMMDCKKALTETDGDIEGAIDLLRAKGAAKAAKRAEKAANEGTIGSYVHFDKRTAVIVELNCETDFTARNDAFNSLTKELCLHIAASGPEFVSRDAIPAANLDKQRDIFQGQAQEEGKPEKIWEKIVSGRMEKWLKEACLLDQPWFRDSDKTVQAVLQEIIAQTGENIKVRRFVRWDLGEAL